ncbi:MAG TPA: biotin/lipoyl-binding protein, partial [Chitinophagaceae bacterium]|nr:biotin/lipoyl-binding protein [Chitinophagaceae bacterium]
MKKKLKTISIILLFPIAAFAVWKVGFGKKNEAVTVETAKVTVGDISTKVTATGTLQPVDTVAVGTQVSGTIKNVYADFNSTVKKGQLLAELDRSLLEASTNQFAANLMQAQSQAVFQQS